MSLRCQIGDDICDFYCTCSHNPCLSCYLFCMPLQALVEAAAEQGSFAAVRKLLSEYLRAERAHSPIIALSMPPGGAHVAPALIRRGPVLRCLQPAEPVTALAQSACAPGHHASSQVTLALGNSLQRSMTPALYTLHGSPQWGESCLQRPVHSSILVQMRIHCCAWHHALVSFWPHSFRRRLPCT